MERTIGNEAAMLFEEHGEVIALLRTNGKPGILARSTPPYAQWSHEPLNRWVGGQMMKRWNGRVLVGSRKWLTPIQKGGKAVTMLSWLVGCELIDVLQLPSGGDNSYTGFVPLSETHALVSYYSSHEGSGTKLAPSAIYVAEIKLAE